MDTQFCRRGHMPLSPWDYPRHARQHRNPSGGDKLLGISGESFEQREKGQVRVESVSHDSAPTNKVTAAIYGTLGIVRSIYDTTVLLARSLAP